MRTRSFLFLPLEFWALSMALHIALWGWVRWDRRKPVLDLTGLTLDLVPKSSAPSAGPQLDPHNEVWRRLDRTKAPPKPSLALQPPPVISAPVPSMETGGEGATRSYSAGELGRMPQPLKEVLPVYPIEAKKQGIEGVVILQVDIDATGAVKKVALVKGLGFGCDEAAMEALWNTPFSSPISRDGRAVPAQTTFTYRFRLNEIDAP